MRKIKIFGERNTGTNYLKELVRRNFKVDVIEGVPTLNYMRLNKLLFFIPKQKIIDFYFSNYHKSSLGWKHSYPNSSLINKDQRYINDDLFIFCLAKNPYAWLLSMYKRPHHFSANITELSFIEFLEFPWPTLGRDNVDKPLKNIIDVYNVKYRSYLEFVKSNKNSVLFQYEELILDTEKCMQKISSSFGLERIAEFNNVSKSMKRDKDKNFDYYRDFYGNEKWRQKLGSESLQVINSYLDSAVIEELGYDLIHNI